MSNVYNTGHTMVVRVMPNGNLLWSVLDENNVSVDPHTDKFTKGTKRAVLLQSLCTPANRVGTMNPAQHRFPLDDYLRLCDEQQKYVRPFPQPLNWG